MIAWPIGWHLLAYPNLACNGCDGNGGGGGMTDMYMDKQLGVYEKRVGNPRAKQSININEC